MPTKNERKPQTHYSVYGNKNKIGYINSQCQVPNFGHTALSVPKVPLLSNLLYAVSFITSIAISWKTYINEKPYLRAWEQEANTGITFNLVPFWQ
jgi:hypothetical protein